MIASQVEQDENINPRNNDVLGLAVSRSLAKKKSISHINDIHAVKMNLFRDANDADPFERAVERVLSNREKVIIVIIKDVHDLHNYNL